MPQDVRIDTAAMPRSREATPDDVRLRRFEARDVPSAHALSSQLGWPHWIEDWQFAFSLGEGVVAASEERVLGTALSWCWGENDATIGLVIVAPELQGRRIGNRMMEALLERLAPRNVLLHATAAGRGLYERLGFVVTGEVDQHQGMLHGLPEVVLRESDRLRPFGGGDAEALSAIDARAAGMPRTELLRRLFAQGMTVVLERGGEVTGFAVLRRFGRGHAIGPVAAPDLDAARALIAACCRQAEGFVRIDGHATSGLQRWLETLGLSRTGDATVMVRGRVSQRGPAQGGWAVVSQATG